jgi:phosphoserine phosphatase RsbX
MEEIVNPIIEWEVASQSLAGAEFSGDAYVVRPFDSSVLVAAIDGLGHGKEAAVAAGIAVTTLTNDPPEEVIPLFKRCHEELTKTRGAVMSIASFNAEDDSMTWLGVGNVEGLLLRKNRQTKPAHESLFLRGGIVGYHLPSLRSSTLPVKRGDLLIFHTDGIRSGFDKDLKLTDSPRRIADMIIKNFNRQTDDALVIVVRYTGSSL